MDKTTTMPKVSVVIPVYNVEKYLRQCMDSVVNQTLRELEIIAVDDGSTDSSGAILDEYAAADPRVKVIHKANGGYGIGMNTGFDAATGEYIGIVESDDYADPEMFEILYNRAKSQNLDVVKSGFYYYWSQPEERNEKVVIASAVMANRTLCPRTEFQAPMEKVEVFNIKPTIWSAIYRRDFIRQNHIRFNETPGASYQDAGFNFKVWTCANRIQLLQECFLHYRQDNEASSIHSPGKVYCIADEYREMDRFLREEKPYLRNLVEGVRLAIKYDSYMWNYERLTESLAVEFLNFASEDFQKDMASGYLEKKYFPWYKWKNIQVIMEQPMEFHQWRKAQKEGREYKIKNFREDAPFSERLKEKLSLTRRYLRQYGLLYTMKKVFNAVAWRVFRR